MIIIITGSTHTGKTFLSQKLLEKYHMPYISQDHIKMGLIRSGYTNITPDLSDEAMTGYIWPVTREMIKTAIENHQNLIVEGCYVPFDWYKDFDEEYLKEIKFVCLCFSDKYIEDNYADIMKYEGCIENRVDDGYCTIELLKKENRRFLEGCIKNNLPCTLIEKDYKKTLEGIDI